MSTVKQKLDRKMNSRAGVKQLPTSKRLKRHQGQASQSGLALRETLRVLIADDCKDTVETMSMLMEMWGYDAAKAYDGPTALKTASTYRPHVLLLDIAMPRMNGCHLASLLRQVPYLQDALLVAITGCTSAEQRELCKQTGFDYFFLKPVSPAIVERLLSREQERLTKTAVASDGFSPRDSRNNMVGDCRFRVIA
jgi:CheY-like chemotaxis protein